ncbi:MAG TPA: hypothetical protein VFW63_06575 [Acidimicrobiales bacterium]|nr:hypothetical protein [Acidimicrobiales bacterium]
MTGVPIAVTGSAGAGATGARARPSRRAPGWWRSPVLLALPCLLLLERAWDRRWMTDDGFINLRVVRMVEAGHGPVFNVGERVEVTTSTLWLWLLTLGDLVLPLPLEWVAVALGIVLSVSGLALATAGAARAHRAAGATGVLVPAGALVLAVVPPVWDFSTSGLEGGLTFGWLGAVTWLLSRWASGDDRPLRAPAAVVLGLGPLVRPDLALVTGVALGGTLAARWPAERWADRLRVVASAAALPLAHQVFRMGYYGSLVPNTALAKSSGRGRWATGYAYLRDMVEPYGLVLPVVALVAVALVPAAARAWRSGDRRVAVALGALPVAGVLDALYVVRVGGDYMHGRLLLPGLFALLAPVAAVPAPRRRPAAAVALLATLAWSAACLAWLRPPASSSVPGLLSSDARSGSVALFGEHAVTARDQGWGPGAPGLRLERPGQVQVGLGLVTVDPPPELRTPAYADYGIGVVGYSYGPDVTVIDLLGLADPIGSRFEVARPGATGHEKPLPAAWLAAHISEAPVDPAALPRPFVARPLYESPPGRFAEDVASARAAVRCDELADLLDAVRAPLTPGRFLANLAASPRLTSLTVPPPPGAAESRFCGR